MGKNQYVVKHEKEWGVIGENNTRLTKKFDTQKAAIKFATNIAKNQQSELRVQDRIGKFKKCNSYGGDSCPPKDKNY